MGAVLWVAAPWLPIGAPPSAGSPEHVFASLPLVAMPLALRLASELHRPEGLWTKSLYALAQRIQPIAAAMVLASFFVPKGAVAGGLTVGWLAMAVAIAVGGLQSVKPRLGVNLSNVSLLSAHVFLPVGAVWLLLSRLGVGPRNFAALTVLLAAIHFHFSGFALQIVIAATARTLQDSASRWSMVHRCVAVAAIVGIPLIAAGNLLAFPPMKFVGVASMTLAAIALAAASVAIAFASRSPWTRGLLFIAATSVAAGMIVAGIYGVGELMGKGWVGIPRMTRVHGLFNALGFTLCSLSAHLRLSRHA